MKPWQEATNTIFFFDEAFWSDVILMNKKGNDFLHLTEMTVQ